MLREQEDRIATIVNSLIASINENDSAIIVTTATTYFGTTSLATALARASTNIGGTTYATYTFTHQSVACTNDTAVFANLDALNTYFYNLSLTTTGKGASLVGIYDTADYFTGVNAETVLAEIGLQLSSTKGAYVFTTQGAVLTNADAVYSALNKLNTWAASLGLTTNHNGAYKIGIEDADGYVTLTTVEGFIHEIVTQLGGTTSSTYTFTHSAAGNFAGCTNNTAVYANLNALNNYAYIANLDDLTAHTCIPIPVGSMWGAAGVPLAVYSTANTPGFYQIGGKEIVVKFHLGGTYTKAGFAVPLPSDWDGTAGCSIHFYATMDGATDTPVLAVNAYFNVGDTDCSSGNTAALSGSIQDVSVTVSAADNPDAYPGVLNVMFLPSGTHTTNTTYIYGCWVEYTRKRRTS